MESAVKISSVLMIIFMLLECTGAIGCTTASEQPSVRIIAASDSSEQFKSQADVVCDGVADQVEIISALAAIQPGGKVLLTPGTFHCDADIHLEPDTTLEGYGESETYLDFSGDSLGVIMDNHHLTLRDLTIRGCGCVFISQASYVAVHRVTVRSPNLRLNGAFSMWMNANETLNDIEFIDCKALNVPGFGYWTCGDGPGQVQKNVRYINCQAIGCGVGEGAPSKTPGLWSCGFSLQETNAAEDILVKGCYAEGNWQSGFHQEPSYPTKNFTIMDCISINNGQKARYVKNPDTLDGSPDMVFGAGYFLGTNATLRNCTAEGNYHGVELWWGQGCIVEDCMTNNSQAEDYFLVHNSGRLAPNVFRNCTSGFAGRQALCAAPGTTGAYFTNFTIMNPHGDGTSCMMIGGYDDESDIYGPCVDSFFDVRVSAGGSPIVLDVVHGRNLTFTGTIETTQPYPVYIDGWDTKYISIEGMHIGIESEDQSSAGMVILPAVNKAGTIRVIDSTILDSRENPGLQYGVNNLAQEQVMVSNLTVIGATTPCSHCNITDLGFSGARKSPS